MPTAARTTDIAASPRILVNKVPEVTVYFWLIKVLATTVGETAADFLNTNLNLGLTGTTYVMGAVLIVVLAVQFRLRRYLPAVYWLAVVLLSIVGTLITDNLTDNFGVSLVSATVAFTIALSATFIAWFISEKTLSIHTIHTSTREGFYWATILFTFALGTAAGDLTAERLNLGYATSALIFAVLIAAITIAHKTMGLNAVLAFWSAYILTRPLGASLGDYLSQSRDDGGLNLGTITTSALFLAAILALVTYLGITKRDTSPAPAPNPDTHALTGAARRPVIDRRGLTRSATRKTFPRVDQSSDRVSQQPPPPALPHP